MTTRPALSATTASGGMASPRSVRTTVRPAPVSLMAEAMAPGPSKATCCTSSQGSPALIVDSGDADDPEELGGPAFEQPGQLAVGTRPVLDPLCHGIGIRQLALVAHERGHLPLHRGGGI